MTVRIPRWAVAAFIGMMLLITICVGGIANWLFNSRDQVQANKAAIHEIIRDRSTLHEHTIVSLVPAQTLNADQPPTATSRPTRPTPTTSRVPVTTQPAPAVPAPPITVPTTTPGVLGRVVGRLLGAQGVPPHVLISVAVACLILACAGLWWAFWMRPWVR